MACSAHSDGRNETFPNEEKAWGPRRASGVPLADEKEGAETQENLKKTGDNSKTPQFVTKATFRPAKISL